MAKILLVEDDADVALSVQQCLKLERHTVDSVSTGADALTWLDAGVFDVIVLDWELPDCSGIDVLRQFRARKGKTPVLMLTARGSLNDKTSGFESGADDYLTKPFAPKELALRIAALLRRPPDMMENIFKAGSFELDSNTGCLLRNGESIKLLPKEFALLALLIKYPGQLFSADAIIQRVWPTDSEVSPELVKVYITKLRRKIDTEGKPSVITNLYGQGYKLDLPLD